MIEINSATDSEKAINRFVGQPEPLSQQTVRDFEAPMDPPSWLKLATELRVLGEAARVPTALRRSFFKSSIRQSM